MHRTHLWSKQIEEKKKQNQLHFQRQWNEETLERRKNWGVAVSRSAPSPCVTVTSDSRRPMLQDCKCMAVWWWPFFFLKKNRGKSCTGLGSSGHQYNAAEHRIRHKPMQQQARATAGIASAVLRPLWEVPKKTRVKLRGLTTQAPSKHREKYYKEKSELLTRIKRKPGKLSPINVEKCRNRNGRGTLTSRYCSSHSA